MFLSKFKEYVDFINECKLIEPDINYHKHHIKPRYDGGTNEPDNLIKLSYINHKKAHLLLAECFPKDSKYYMYNIYAARMLSKWTDEDRTKWKTISNRKNCVMTEEQKNKIGATLKEAYKKGRKKPVEKGSTLSEEHKSKISSSLKGTQCGEKNSMWGKGKKVEVNGVIYDSIVICARQLGLHVKTVTYRINNNNELNWKRI